MTTSDMFALAALTLIADRSTTGQDGGRGGYNNSWTGENGHPVIGGGGQAGGSTTTEGQAATSAGDMAGGAGGGGAKGGLSGLSGGGAGGGAGSSAAPGLTNATVTTENPSDSVVPDTYVTFSYVS